MFDADKWKSRDYPDGCSECPDGEKFKRRHAARGLCSKHYDRARQVERAGVDGDFADKMVETAELAESLGIDVGGKNLVQVEALIVAAQEEKRARELDRHVHTEDCADGAGVDATLVCGYGHPSCDERAPHTGPRNLDSNNLFTPTEPGGEVTAHGVREFVRKHAADVGAGIYIVEDASARLGIEAGYYVGSEVVDYLERKFALPTEDCPADEPCCEGEDTMSPTCCGRCDDPDPSARRCLIERAAKVHAKAISQHFRSLEQMELALAAYNTAAGIAKESAASANEASEVLEELGVIVAVDLPMLTGETSMDPEIRAMYDVRDALDPLDRRAQIRVLTWASARFGLDRPAEPRIVDQPAP